MKSYTDIEQSKKLAEILPLESADMKWMYWKSEIDTPKVPTFGYGKFAAECYNNNTEGVYLPCWSLAALLSVLPDNCGVDKEGGKYVASYIFASYIFISNECGAYTKDNPIDACYEMIMYFHKLNLL